MSRIENIEDQIKELSAQEVATLREWFTSLIRSGRRGR
jgi:hypothetical protein